MSKMLLSQRKPERQSSCDVLDANIITTLHIVQTQDFGISTPLPNEMPGDSGKATWCTQVLGWNRIRKPGIGAKKGIFFGKISHEMPIFAVFLLKRGHYV